MAGSWTESQKRELLSVRAEGGIDRKPSGKVSFKWCTACASVALLPSAGLSRGPSASITMPGVKGHRTEKVAAWVNREKKKKITGVPERLSL